MDFSVWAPRAKAVEIELDGGRTPMERAERGWWRTDRPAQSGVSRYRFVVDGGEPTPDPRSRWQPEGVHAASVVWNTADYAQRARPRFEAAPLAEAVIYEVHIGTFTAEGTYRAAIARLPHLHALGVTHLEVMPLATFPGERGWGYDGVYLFAPHPAYGTPDDLVAFIDACHQHQIAVLLDVVYNHLGPSGNYLSRFGPYFTDHRQTPWGDAVNYDAEESDEVRAFVFDNALMWLRDYGFDGLRLDAVHAILDDRALHLLEELANRVREYGRASGRGLLLIAESDRNDPRYVRPPERGGYGLDAHWADELHHTLHTVLTGEREGYYSDFGRVGQIARALRDGYVFQGDYSPFRRRSHGRPPEGVAPEQLVVCAQNHDQIGNRALGDRLSATLSEEKLQLIGTLILLSPFTPMLFQGEEWAAQSPFLYFTDHEEELGHAITEGRRHEFADFAWNPESVPDPQARETFTRSKLQWDEVGRDRHAAMLTWYQELLRLRRQFVVPARAEREVRCDEAAGWLVYRVGRLLVTCNLSDRPQLVPPLPGDWQLVLAAGQSLTTPAEPLPPWRVAVWSRR